MTVEPGTKWAKMPPLKGGTNGPKEVIHAKEMFMKVQIN